MLLDEEQRSVLNNIAKNKRDVEDCCTELFKYWLNVSPDASWNKLLKALETMKQNSLVEKIKRKFLTGIVITPFMYMNMYVASYT